MIVFTVTTFASFEGQLEAHKDVCKSTKRLFLCQRAFRKNFGTYAFPETVATLS